MHLGPDEVLLTIEVAFSPGLTAEEVHVAVHRIERAISRVHPQVSRIFIEVESLAAAVAGAGSAPDDPAPDAAPDDPRA